jgi:threonine dehydratase
MHYNSPKKTKWFSFHLSITLKVIEGQGTVAKEILEEQSNIDYVFVPIGGGGLCAGLIRYFETYSPNTK